MKYFGLIGYILVNIELKFISGLVPIHRLSSFFSRRSLLSISSFFVGSPLIPYREGNESKSICIHIIKSIYKQVVDLLLEFFFYCDSRVLFKLALINFACFKIRFMSRKHQKHILSTSFVTNSQLVSYSPDQIYHCMIDKPF